MFRTAIASVLVTLVSVTLCLAADFDGRWEGKVKGPDGNDMQLAFTFKAEGDTLTGTVQSPMGELPLSEGKVKGDEISFNVETPGGTITHTAKLAGDTLTVHAHGPWGDVQYDLKHPAAK